MLISVDKRWFKRCAAYGDCLNIKMSSYQYGDAHAKDKTVPRPSNLQHGNPIPGKTIFTLRQGPNPMIDYRSNISLIDCDGNNKIIQTVHYWSSLWWIHLMPANRNFNLKIGKVTRINKTKIVLPWLFYIINTNKCLAHRPPLVTFTQ